MLTFSSCLGFKIHNFCFSYMSNSYEATWCSLVPLWRLWYKREICSPFRDAASLCHRQNKLLWRQQPACLILYVWFCTTYPHDILRKLNLRHFCLVQYLSTRLYCYIKLLNCQEAGYNRSNNGGEIFAFHRSERFAQIMSIFQRHSCDENILSSFRETWATMRSLA